MKHLAARRFAVVYLAACSLAIPSASLADDPTLDGPESATARVQVIIQSRNGPAILSIVLERLRKLMGNPEYAAVLVPDSVSEEVKSCSRDARKDPSGRVFDLAQCARVWPPSDKATFEKAFERSFNDAAKKRGTRAFPAVTVTPFDFELRLQPTQFPKESFDQMLESEPSAQFKEALCKANVTFIAPELCKEHIRVVPRTRAYMPDIYVPQTGYRMEVSRRMRPELASSLRRALLKDLPLPEATPENAVRVAVTRPDAIKKEQSDRPLAVPAEKPGVQDGKGIAALWASLGTSTDRLDLSRSSDGRPPILYVFDEVQAQVPIVEWLESVRFAPAGTLGCTATSGHSDAVAGSLFPNVVLSKLRGEATPAESSLVDWSGKIVGGQYFKPDTQIAGAPPWHNRPVFAKNRDPIVALTVFSDYYDLKDQGTAKNAAISFLSEKSNLLIVAATQKKKVPRSFNFEAESPLDPPISRPSDLEESCRGRAWPACLGKHPRVVVVGSSSYPESDQRANVLLPDDYYLGASVVRMLAPGGNIPVLARCATPGASGGTQFGIATEAGTSFAAPLVALVASRMLQIGPANLRNYLPEAALWRLLATTTPLSAPIDAPEHVQFGRLDAGRALSGISPSEIGKDEAAVLYEVDDVGKEISSSAVVHPFPWMDQPVLLNGSAVERGLLKDMKRGVLTITQYKPDGSPSYREALDFRRVLRIARRPSDSLDGVPLFDIYYVSGLDLKYVSVRRRVQLGSGKDIEREGYCRATGGPLRGDGTRANQAQPACLYTWRAGKPGFEALDLRKVRDIVFPPLHFDAEEVAGLSAANVKAITAATSPWSMELCRIGPRHEMEKALTSTKQANWEAACKR